MRWAGKSRRTVFILGAGATRGAVPHVVLNRKLLKSPLNRDFFSVIEAFVRADKKHASRYARLKSTLQSEFPIRGKWPFPMEVAFSLLYVSKDFPEIYAKGAGRRRRAGTRTEIEDFLRLTFGILTEIGLKAPVENLYSSLTRHLESSDTVITLNYDTVLDTALVRSGWPPGKGYCVIGGSNKLSGGVPNSAGCERLSGVKLLKLHGSLNWLVRGSYADLAHVFESKPSQIVIGETRKRERIGFIRQIIPPIYGKFFRHNHWQVLWEHAYQAILEAEAIVVIGCSLVETDFHLTGMLGHAVGERKRQNRSFDYEILVDNTKTRRKWHRLLGRNVRTRVDFANFAKFVSALDRNREGGV